MGIGRNDPCPCGSGKKYKKCCIDSKVEFEINPYGPYKDLFTYERVDEWGTGEIIEKLAAMNIPFDEATFLQEIQTYYSAEGLSESWFEKYDVKAPGLEEDIPLVSAWVLWNRLAPENILPFEAMDIFLEEGYEYLEENDSVRACDVWLKMWDALKQRIKPIFTTLDYLEDKNVMDFSFRDVVQELEMELQNAGRVDPTYFKKRIIFCREFCNYFPGEAELITHNMQRAIAESYGWLKDYENANKEFTKLVAEYPDNPWGYIGWGDIYMRDDLSKARGLYEKALEIATDKEDIESIKDRLVSL